MSHIQPKLVEFIDSKILSSPFVLHLIDIGDARALMVEAAKACVGIMEATGNNDGEMVELLQKTIGDAQRESWCMSAVQSWAAYAALKCKVKTALFESEHCLTVWQNTKEIQRVKYLPLAGAVIIWQHGSSSNGHTGIVLSCDGVTIKAIEANTVAGSEKNGGPVVREGGGIYYTTRQCVGTPEMRIVGYLKPF